ncbi:MAG: hypothetical protein AAFQ68_15690 [Bacteroidota bacterium]
MASAASKLHSLSEEQLSKRYQRNQTLMRIAIGIMVVSIAFTAYLIFSKQETLWGIPPQVINILTPATLLVLWLPFMNDQRGVKKEMARREGSTS